MAAKGSKASAIPSSLRVSGLRSHSTGAPVASRFAGMDLLERRRTLSGGMSFPSCDGTVRRLESSCRAFSQGQRMEHSGHLHPEFGLLSPTPRLRRELRIAAISLLFGGIAGALCVSGGVALRHSDRAAMEIAEAPHAAASQETELGSGPSGDARAASPESHAGTAAQASAEVPAPA